MLVLSRWENDGAAQQGGGAPRTPIQAVFEGVVVGSCMCWLKVNVEWLGQHRR